MPKIVEGMKGQRWKYSQFFITINTNRKDYDKAKLKSALGQIFSSDEMFYALLTGDMSKVDKEWATAQFAVEVGPKTGFIHSHILIKLRHNTKVHFKIDLLRKVLEKQLGLDGVHIDLIASGMSDKTLQEYIFKDQ